MNKNNSINTSEGNDCITLNNRADINYWCQRLSVSPFALYQLIKYWGNNSREIEAFLHNEKAAQANMKEHMSEVGHS